MFELRVLESRPAATSSTRLVGRSGTLRRETAPGPCHPRRRGRLRRGLLDIVVPDIRTISTRKRNTQTELQPCGPVHGQSRALSLWRRCAIAALARAGGPTGQGRACAGGGLAMKEASYGAVEPENGDRSGGYQNLGRF